MARLVSSGHEQGIRGSGLQLLHDNARVLSRSGNRRIAIRHDCFIVRRDLHIGRKWICVDKAAFTHSHSHRRIIVSCIHRYHRQQRRRCSYALEPARTPLPKTETIVRAMRTYASARSSKSLRKNKNSFSLKVCSFVFNDTVNETPRGTLTHRFRFGGYGREEILSINATLRIPASLHRFVHSRCAHSLRFQQTLPHSIFTLSKALPSHTPNSPSVPLPTPWHPPFHWQGLWHPLFHWQWLQHLLPH